MATKVGPSTVSYGIGVQNRYSAFLEDEDNFALSNVVKKPTNENHVSKPKNNVSGAKSNSAKAGQRSETSSTNQNKKQEGQKSSLAPANGHQHKGEMRRQQRDGKPQQQQQQPQQASGANGQPGRYHGNRNKNQSYNQDSTANASGTQRFPRNQNNVVHQHQQLENATQQQVNSNGRPMRPNNLRSNGRPRVQNEDKKANQQQQLDSQQLNGLLASNDDEKARRQQRRLNNLRFKDPEKRERRNQNVAADGADSQAKASEHNGEAPTDQRGQRNKRDLDKNRAGPRRNNPTGDFNGENNRRDNKRERPNRQRGGAGGPHPEVGSKQEKVKPIPNFSDKSDFPSLAS